MRGCGPSYLFSHSQSHSRFRLIGNHSEECLSASLSRHTLRFPLQVRPNHSGNHKIAWTRPGVGSRRSRAGSSCNHRFRCQHTGLRLNLSAQQVQLQHRQMQTQANICHLCPRNLVLGTCRNFVPSRMALSMQLWKVTISTTIL